MRLPLFVAARPSDGLCSPSVLLRPGKWKLQSTGTSILQIIGEGHLEVEVIEPTRFTVTIVKAGPEPHLSAEFYNGVD